MNLRLSLLTVFSGLCLLSQAERVENVLDGKWMFRFSHQVERGSAIEVHVPHTWNAMDALSGNLAYKRGIGNYEKNLFIDRKNEGKRLFLRFGGVNSVASLFINGKFVGEHRGGYSAFIFEITDRVRYGEENTILVRVNNGEQLDIMPLVGDFNFYGGIYRDVSLIVTEKACITPLDYASPGVYLTQESVSDNEAKVNALVKLSNQGLKKDLRVEAVVKDRQSVVTRQSKSVILEADGNGEVVLPLFIKKPHLWNGTKDPFMYQVEVTLWNKDNQLDCLVQPLGLRYYHIDPDKGFFLNGEHLTLQGVCRHQDRPEIGNALRKEHHEEDVDIMLEMGVNATRLAHYQQAEDMYDLMDKHGIITWAEIPFVGPGGYLDKGFVDSPAFRANGKKQLIELIRQNYNHPSICYWGIFNELKEKGDNPIEYIKELNQLAHQEDTKRPTTAASNQSGDMNFITDLICWNRYDGWYGGMPQVLATYLDKTHKSHPQLCIGISEYGAGASIYHQVDTLARPKPVSFWHPENWQTFYHIENWKIIHERPFVWGSFVWNMFDFGAAHRHEGDRLGVNDKGLVTFDRKTRKDAFYFYKANWNPEKMVHIAGKRCTTASTDRRDLLVFTNCGQVELFVNDKSLGKKEADAYAIVEWKDVPLQKGTNTIRVKSVKKPIITDSFIVER